MILTLYLIFFITKEEKIKEDDLITTPENIKKSKFFNALFKAIGKNISTIETAYKKAKKSPGHKKSISKHNKSES
ncbi:hypothetical protein [Brachyspira murdochii]|uniref:hypothetical protein n=1 Tax=Brachyspira murdochii TaxID=84378 RepID=UPI001E390A00|nr:hypothetical protein [Brachyspira murdochii]